MTYALVKPHGRRRLWRVECRVLGKVSGYWACDSEAIARELLRRVKKDKAPGWVAYDLSHSQEKRAAGGERNAKERR